MSKKLVAKRNAQIKKLADCTRDPAIMLFLMTTMASLRDKIARRDAMLYQLDMVFMIWASSKNYFKKGEVEKFVKASQDHIYNMPPSMAKAQSLLTRMRKYGYLDYYQIKGLKTWFVTPKGKIYLIDLTTELRNSVLSVLKLLKDPKPQRKKRPVYEILDPFW